MGYDQRGFQGTKGKASGVTSSQVLGSGSLASFQRCQKRASACWARSASSTQAESSQLLEMSAQQGPNPQGEDAFEFRLARQPVGEQIDQPQQIRVLGWVLAVAATDPSPPGRNRRSRSSSATTAR